MIGQLLLRLAIWFLLTANLSLTNILIGLAIALLLPYGSGSRTQLKDLLQGLGKIIVAIPQAYQEAIELILRPHTQEEIVRERVPPRGASGRGALPTPGMVFLDIFLITFTPKTTVLNYDEAGWYTVHHVRRRRSR